MGQIGNDQGEVVGSVSKTLSSQESQLAVHQENYVAFEDSEDALLCFGPQLRPPVHDLPTVWTGLVRLHSPELMSL